MCIIIVNQKGAELPKKVLQNSSRKNPHGLGIVWLDTYETTYHKSADWEELVTDRPFIAHFRYATVGSIGLENMHPFRCGETDELLMMNGTIRGLGNKKSCDTKVLAGMLGTQPRESWKSQLERHNSRFVTVNDKNKTFQIYNRDLWAKKDGVWYSKTNVLDTTELVAVYGTLKIGQSNNSYIRGCRHIGSGETLDEYPMIIKGLPYLVKEKGVGYNVEVDVFEVGEFDLRGLDRLEGHPNWYRREKTEIKLDNGRHVSAWVY